MIVAGCDIGSLSAKAVIMSNGNILASHVIYAKPEPEELAREVMDGALKKAGISMDEIKYSIATGYGRNHVPFTNGSESEIACHGRGAQWIMPDVRMVIDIGGQDAKAIRLNENGNVIRYAYNDKCASGTGRFLEIMAGALDVELEEMGEISLRARNPVTISNQCVVFAETEIISLINEGRDLSDIISGLHRSMAHRVASLAKSIELEATITMTGGVAKNKGMFTALKEALGVEIRKMEADPQIMGALGAALFARQAVSGNKQD